MINIISLACIAIMVFSALTFFYNLIRKNRADRIEYIRSFKKGKGVVMYIYAIPLFWVGYYNDNKDIIDSLFSAIKRSVDLIILGYDTTHIKDTINSHPIYRVAIYTCFSFAAINSILLIISFAHQYIWHYFQIRKFERSNKDKLILFGNNPQNHAIYFSDKERAKIIIDEVAISDSKYNDDILYKKKILHRNQKTTEDYIGKIVQDILSKDNKFIIIINTNNDSANIKICNYFVRAISDLNLSEAKYAECFKQLRIFTFGDPKFETIYENIVDNGHGCISYINKYRKSAIEAIEKHPFSLYLNDEQVNYETACINEGYEINALLIGFGKTNQQFFLTSVANNQFITMKDSRVVPKLVNYHLFDHEAMLSSKKLNHSYNRYNNEFGKIIIYEQNKDEQNREYLPLPKQPANTLFHKLDINAEEFYTDIRQIVCNKDFTNINYVVIAFGSDLENIDMAQKLSSKFKEWEVKNFHILIKVRNAHNEVLFTEDDHCHIIGNEDQTIYNIDNITSDSLTQMAQSRNAYYEIERVVTQRQQELEQTEIDKIKLQSYKDWYMRIPQLDRESSAYCCLSLRSKLNLMGLDCCPKTGKDGKEVSNKKYFEIYAKNTTLVVSELNADGKLIINYPSEFDEGLRKNLAIHEHLRWNAFMISKGMVPAPKSALACEKIDGEYTNGKNIKLRRHGCITTYEGLLEYRKIVAARGSEGKKPTPEELQRADVIKYDYQLMDDAHWLLTHNGYKIVKKK